MIKETKLLPPGAAAFTVCPVIFVRRGLTDYQLNILLTHENVHWWQQFWFGLIGAILGMASWVVMGWPVEPTTAVLALLGLAEGWVAGQLIWRGLYLLVLPVGWNYFRFRWEYTAFKAECRAHTNIIGVLKKAPYHLWWMS